jgi:hypothetical protein
MSQSVVEQAQSEEEEGMKKLYEGYLTEKKLGESLQELYPGVEWIHNKVVPDSGIRSRPDFRSEELKLIVEYNGHLHFTLAKSCLNDIRKSTVYTEMGYKVVEIPYFIQLCPCVIASLFEERTPEAVNSVVPTDFPNGFITDSCVLPADFCTAGLFIFSLMLKNRLSHVAGEVFKSLEDKVKTTEEVLVHPIGFKTLEDYIKYSS